VQAESAPQPPGLAIRRAGKSLYILKSRDEVPVRLAESDTATTATAQWSVADGDRVQLDARLSSSERAAALSSLRPASEDSVWDKTDDNDNWTSESAEARIPLDADIEVDGRPWGWFRANTWGSGDPECWTLLPMNYQADAEKIAEFRGWNTEGGVSASCKLADSIAVMLYWLGDIRLVRVKYNVVDSTAAVEALFYGMLWPSQFDDRLCPRVENTKDEGQWFWAAESGVEALGQFLTVFWAPCRDHDGQPGEDELEMSDHLWKWDRNHWTLART